ncbi:MAG: hypothetical protein WBZ48_07555 [Bacteroidota bacterium]
MSNKYFSKINQRIPFEGKDSKNPFAFKYYDKNQRVGCRTMEEHLRFSVACWHSYLGNGTDMFGGPSFDRALRQSSDRMNSSKEMLENILNSYILR